jgi:hypothetical protein
MTFKGVFLAALAVYFIVVGSLMGASVIVARVIKTRAARDRARNRKYMATPDAGAPEDPRAKGE